MRICLLDPRSALVVSSIFCYSTLATWFMATLFQPILVACQRDNANPQKARYDLVQTLSVMFVESSTSNSNNSYTAVNL